jgi:predicted nucleic acid-binding protein
LRLIDTNVVVYAVGKARPLQEEARSVLDRIAEGALHANVDAGLLQEILHVYDARKKRAKGFDAIAISWCFSRTRFR